MSLLPIHSQNLSSLDSKSVRSEVTPIKYPEVVLSLPTRIRKTEEPPAPEIRKK